MLKKLRTKFVIINMVIITAMLLVIFGVVYRFTATNLEQESTAALQTLSQAVQQPGSPGNKRPPVQLPYFTLRISLWGEITASGNTYFDLSDPELLQELIQQVYTSDTATGTLEQYGLRFSRSASPGQQYVVFVDISGQTSALQALVQTGAIVGLIALAVFWLISILLARWAVRPVEKAWQQQKQFVSDASHELKTPLAVIMSNAELLQDQAPEDTSGYAANIVTMSRQMRSLVEGLLELARADNGQIQKQFTDVDYSTLVEEALLPFEAVLYEQQMILSAQIQPEIRVMGSAQYLRQVIDILIDNAQKYGAPGTVSVCLCRQGKNQCLLTVANPGEPIPTEELEKIFHRFYRADKTRSRTGSFGLGLSIAQSVVSEHGGKIWAESNPTGNCFFVQLPCAGA